MGIFHLRRLEQLRSETLTRQLREPIEECRVVNCRTPNVFQKDVLEVEAQREVLEIRKLERRGIGCNTDTTRLWPDHYFSQSKSFTASTALPHVFLDRQSTEDSSTPETLDGVS
jgi:hypothetical protein